MVFRTRVIVRLGRQNRMVTKGYQKGVYEWGYQGNQSQSQLNCYWHDTVKRFTDAPIQPAPVFG